jgi:inosine/xanthosine triphosphatase
MITMKVAVGSANPVKIKAVENVFRKVFGDVKIQSAGADSGVSHTPSSWEEIAQGAINRAKSALKSVNADFGVGLEGGYEKTRFGTLIRGAVAIIDKENRLGISGGKGILLPPRIVERLEQEEELGNIMDEFQGEKNTKQKWGAVGFFTRHHSNRQESFEQDVLYALARFLRKELYE